MIKYDFFKNSFKVKDKNDAWWEYIRYGISEDEVKAVVKECGEKIAISKLTEEKKIIPIYGGKIEL